MYPSLVKNGLFLMDAGVCARSTNIFTTLSSLLPIQSLLRVNVPYFGPIQTNLPVSYLSLLALILKRSYYLPHYQYTDRKLHHDLVPLKGFAGPNLT